MAQGDKFRCGQITLTGSAQPLTGMASGSNARVKNPGATNPMYVGSDNSVSATTGWPLLPGQELEIDVLNLKNLWVFGTAADKLAWMVVA